MTNVETYQPQQGTEEAPGPKHLADNSPMNEGDHLSFVAGEIDRALRTGKSPDSIIDRQARFLNLSPEDERILREYAQHATKQAAEKGTLVTPNMVVPTPVEKTTLDHISHFAG